MQAWVATAFTLCDEDCSDEAKAQFRALLAQSAVTRDNCPDPLRLGFEPDVNNLPRLIESERRDPLSVDDRFGGPAATVALLARNEPAAVWLLEQHRVTDPTLRASLAKDCARENCFAALHLVLDAETPKDVLGYVLFYAARHGHRDAAERVLGLDPTAAATAKTNVEDGVHVTPLAEACQRAHPDLVDVILARGDGAICAAPPNLHPLVAALRSGRAILARVRIVKALLGADPTMANAVREDTGETMLELAARHGYYSVANVLLLSGADPMPAEGERGRTVLHEAIDVDSPRTANSERSRHRKRIKDLLASLAVSSSPDQLRALLLHPSRSGNTVLHHAEMLGDRDIIRMIRDAAGRCDAAADLDAARNDGGETAADCGKHREAVNAAHRREREEARARGRRNKRAGKLPAKAHPTARRVAQNTKVIHPNQQAVGNRLYEVVAAEMLAGHGDDLLAAFPGGARVAVLAPGRTTLFTQTKSRIESSLQRDPAVPFSVQVIMGSAAFQGDFEPFRKSVLSRRDVLHVIIHDEAHSACTSPAAARRIRQQGDDDGDNDDDDDDAHEVRGAVAHRCLNDSDLLARANLARVLVTATPYALVTANSRIPAENELLWWRLDEARTYRGIAEYRAAMNRAGGDAEPELHRGAIHGEAGDDVDSADALARDYNAALWSARAARDRDPDAAAMSAAMPPPTRATAAIVDTLLGDDPAMVLIRAPDTKAGRAIATALKTTRAAAGFADADAGTAYFEVLCDMDVDYGGKGLCDRIEDATLRHRVRAFDEKNPDKAGTYASLDGVPCVLVLCEKGRMGDTFPPTLAEFDLRLRYRSATVHRASLEQDLGRVCGHKQAGRLPRVFCAPSLASKLRGSLAAMPPDSKVRGRPCAAASDEPMDLDAHRRHTHVTADHYDHGNTKVDPRRFLLVGLPQIGKTGAYVHFLKRVRERCIGGRVAEGGDRERCDDDEQVILPVETVGSLDPAVDEDEEEDPRPRDDNLGRYPDPEAMHEMDHTLGHVAGRYDSGEKQAWRTHGAAEADAAIRAVSMLGPAGRGGVRGQVTAHRVLADDSSVTLHVPAASARAFDAGGEHGRVTGLAAGDGDAVIFRPSSGRAATALLRFPSASQRRIQIVVVHASELEDYARRWPREVFLAFEGAEEPGACIGRARFTIQRVAHTWGLERVWMIDDNVAAFRYLALKRDPLSPARVLHGGRSSSSDDEGWKPPRRCTLDPIPPLGLAEVLGYVERDPRWDAHAVVGFLRPSPGFARCGVLSEAYARQVVEGAFLLNVAATAQHGAWFDPAVSAVSEMDDFAAACNAKGLLVTQYRRLVLIKAPMAGGSRAARRALFEYDRAKRMRKRAGTDSGRRAVSVARKPFVDATDPVPGADDRGDIVSWLAERRIALDADETLIFRANGVTWAYLCDLARGVYHGRDILNALVSLGIRAPRASEVETAVRAELSAIFVHSGK